MGGMKIAGFVALLTLALAWQASADYFEDGCKQTICKVVGQQFSNPNDHCSFCCCVHKDNLNLPSRYRRCPLGKEFNGNTCVPSNRCPATPPPPPTTTPKPTTPKPTTPKPTTTRPPVDPHCDIRDCPQCYAGMDYLMPRKDDICGYCNCTAEGTVIPEKCPGGHGWDQEHQVCTPDIRCNCCNDSMCTECYWGMHIVFPNQRSECGFCCCVEENGREVAEERDCPLGERFDATLSKCVHTDNPECRDRRWKSNTCLPEPTETPCDNCAGVVCDPAHPYKRYENIANKCSFCCCEDRGDGFGFIAHVDECQGEKMYDPISDTCVPSNGICPQHGDQCHSTTVPPTTPPPCYDCYGVVCDPAHPFKRYANIANKCSFCCCEDRGDGFIAHVDKCQGDKMYDPISDTCVPSDGICPDNGDQCHDSTGPSGDVDYDGCSASFCESNCPDFPIPGKDFPLLTNPGGRHSFCQCDYGRRCHWKPCAASTVFKESVQMCI